MTQGHQNNQGWIKLHRQLLKNPIIKKPMYAHLWNILLLMTQHRTTKFIWNNKEWTLTPGQLLTGRKVLSEVSGIPETTIERILSYLETGHQIGQQKTTKFRIITIKNWWKYQSNENGGHQIGQQADNKRTHTRSNKNVKEGVSEEFLNYWNLQPRLPKILRFDKLRLENFKARISEPLFSENWKKIIDTISASKFLTGRGSKKWKADIDWILKNGQNYVKVLEGKYANEDSQPTTEPIDEKAAAYREKLLAGELK